MELPYFRGLALAELGETEQARALFTELGEFADRKAAESVKSDYFATSLPDPLVFDDDLDRGKAAHCDALHRLAEQGLASLAVTAVPNSADAR